MELLILILKILYEYVVYVVISVTLHVNDNV